LLKYPQVWDSQN